MKKISITMITLALAGLASMSAYAGAWAKNAQGWWYDNGNGTWPASTWQWIDGNNDGIAESYYFNPSGYCLTNTTTPDGYIVNADGAWTVNGIIQTKAVGMTTNTTAFQQANQSNVSYEEVLKAYQTYMRKKNTDKYNPIRYSLVYLDGDNIPELIYSTGNYHAEGVRICTYQNGKVYSITANGGDVFGGYGSITYYPGTGYFEADDAHMGYEWDELYLQQGTMAQEVCYTNYNTGDDPGNGTTTEYDEFRIKGVNTTKANAENYRNQLVGALTPSVFQYDNATKLQ